jgi:hypothetical protein
MNVFLFLSGKDNRVFGLTQEKNGSNLPADQAPWDAKKISISDVPELCRFGAPDVIARSIAAKGFYVERAVPSGRLAGVW